VRGSGINGRRIVGGPQKKVRLTANYIKLTAALVAAAMAASSVAAVATPRTV